MNHSRLARIVLSKVRGNWRVDVYAPLARNQRKLVASVSVPPGMKPGEVLTDTNSESFVPERVR